MKGDYYKTLFLYKKYPFDNSLNLLRADEDYLVV
jgi:hypothetical protein